MTASSGPTARATVTRHDVWVGMLLYPRHTLPTAAAPVLVASGLALHDGVAAALPAALAFFAGWLVQLGGVITDNYNNLRRHGDDPEHPAFAEALRAGVVTFGELRLAISATYGVALLAGAWLVALAGIPVLVVGLASIAVSLLYSSGPFPLGDNAGLGDPLFFVFFGLVSVMATYYVQAVGVLGGAQGASLVAGAVTWNGLWASLPPAALTTGILVVDNIRDLEFDRAKNEHTLAVLIGPRWSRTEYLALFGLAYAVPVGLFAAGRFGGWVLAPLASLPYAAVVARRVLRATTHQALIPMTPQTGQVLLAHSILFAAGLAAG